MSRRLNTLRFRFALSVGSLLLVALAAFGAFAYFSLAHGLSAAIDDSLRFSALEIIDGLDFTGNRIDIADNLPNISDSTSAMRRAGLGLRIFTLAGSNPAYAVGPFQQVPVNPADLAAAVNGDSGYATLTDPTQGAPVRVYTTPVTHKKEVAGVLQVLQSTAAMDDSLRRLLAALLVSGPLLVVVSGAGGYVLAARALAPIDRMTSTARRISAEDLSTRLNLPRTEDEVGRLAETFDAMLGRLDDAFRRESRFTGDAAHELRTPLAAVETILDVTLNRRRSAADYRQALADIADEARRLRRLVEDLLRLARGDKQQPAAEERVDLSALLLDVADSLRPLTEANGVKLVVDVPAGLTVYGDSEDLIRLFVNLLDNAFKYTQHGAVRLAARAESQAVTVHVADSGVGIPAEHVPHVFDRFYRADVSRATPGAGLGLSIAHEIALAHRGDIDIQSEVGVGTTCTVRFPRSIP